MAGLLGLGAAVLLGLAALASVLFAIRQPVGFGMFLGLLVGFICGLFGFILLVLTYGYYALRYRFEHQALVIRWLGQAEVIPFSKVDGIFAGPRLGQTMRVRGLNWPGYHVGRGRSRAMGLVRYYTTTNDLAEIALIVTPAATYALSPADAPGFRRELIRRVEESDGDEDRVVADPRAGGFPPVLRDITLPALLIASLALLGLALGYVWMKWDGLPEMIPLHFGADGSPSMVGPRENIFKVPGIGAAILIANLGLGLALYARERAAARMLWATSVVVQLLVLVATVRILH
jgi:hypothetical protein